MWTPRTEDEISAAIESGDLEENSRFDVKRETGTTNSARSETAKDLASFSIDGGALLIGVGEDKQSATFFLEPQPLSGLPEKLEQIAANRVDPPLFIRTTVIPSKADPSLGYVYVEVPPSGSAPHMVDGRYYARADKTTRRLTDAEIVRLHTNRRSESDQILRVLRQERARDPYPAASRRQAHLHIVAEPINAPRGFLIDLVRSDRFEVMQLLSQIENKIDPSLREFAPRPGSAHRWVTRARGVAGSSFEDGDRRAIESTVEERALEIEIEEDGGIRLFLGRLSTSRSDGTERVLFDGLAVAYAIRTVHWAKALADVGGYRGAWGFGMAATGLQGLVSHKFYDSLFERGNPYDREDIETATIATLQEIEDEPAAVAGRFVSPLLRGVGTAELYSEVLGGSSARGN